VLYDECRVGHARLLEMLESSETLVHLQGPIVIATLRQLALLVEQLEDAEPGSTA